MTELSPTPSDASLEAELRALGRSLTLPSPADNLDVILARIDQLPAQNLGQRVAGGLRESGWWLRQRWRTATALLVGVLLVLLAVTPAGARVREWLGFGGVVVVQQSAVQENPSTTQAPSIGPRPGETPMTLEQAHAAVDFPLGASVALPEPSAVTVSTDSRVVSMFWPVEQAAPAGIRLDQLAGESDPYYFKKVVDDVRFTTVGASEAVWLSSPHPIVVRAPDGAEHSESARTAGPALIWQKSGVTLRLEGVNELGRAVEIAETVQF